MKRRIELPDGSPFFAGHFPGHPILPGIAHLALVAQDAPVAEVRNLKLRRPVVPGDVLDLALEEGEGGLVRFELRRGEEIVSNGTIRVGGDEIEVEVARLVPSPYPSPSELIPHAPPALLVERMLEVSPAEASALIVIPEDNPFVAAGRASAFVGLEAGAQTAAALEALSRREGEGGPRIGYVVAIRNAHFRTPWLPAGRPLRVTVRPAGSALPLSIYEIDLGEGLVIGSVSTYIDSSPTAS